MKVIYKTLLICLACVSALTSCKEDNDIPAPGPLDQSEKVAVGIYKGEWAVTNTSTGKVETNPGVVTIGEAVYEDSEKVEYTEHNVNTVSVEGTELRLKAESSVFNVSLNSGGILNYWNVDGNNPFGCAFYGKIMPSGELTLSYSVIVITGRGSKNQVKYNYDFKGIKQ